MINIEIDQNATRARLTAKEVQAIEILMLQKIVQELVDKTMEGRASVKREINL